MLNKTLNKIQNKFVFALFLNVAFFGGIFSTTVSANPDIEHWRTANGTNVHFVPAPELPIVDTRIIFNAGAARQEVASGVAITPHGLMPEGRRGPRA